MDVIMGMMIDVAVNNAITMTVHVEVGIGWRAWAIVDDRWFGVIGRLGVKGDLMLQVDQGWSGWMIQRKALRSRSQCDYWMWGDNRRQGVVVVVAICVGGNGSTEGRAAAASR